MKKLFSLSAALTVALSAAALPAEATYENIPPSRIWDEEIDSFDAMDKGEIPTDINGDGIFDLTDCILFYGYSSGFDYDESMTAAFEAVGDLDGDSIIDKNDGLHFLRYYVSTHYISFRDIDPETYAEYTASFTEDPGEYEYYCHYIPEPRVLGKEFCQELKKNVEYLMAGYPLYCELVDSGKIDPDLNADGKYDMTDLTYFWVSSINNHIFMVNSEELEVPEVDPEIFERSEKIYHVLEKDYSDSPLSLWAYDFTVMYYFDKGNVTGDMITREFFDSVIEGACALGIERDISSRYYEYVPHNEYLDFDGRMFCRQYDKFMADINEGSIERPDTNGDGVLNSLDSFNVRIYTNEMRRGVTETTTILPDNVWNNFKNNMDLNGNGLSGDMNDLTIFDLYSTNDINEEQLADFFDNYIDRLNEYSEQLAAAKNLPPVKFSPDSSAAPMVYEMDAVRSGDTNSDGKMDLADAINIMQSLANPDKYKLSMSERFNGDLDDTGNGITPNDAVAIQERLLGLI